MSGLPGFVDLQVNGYVGISFANGDLTVERAAHACRAYLAAACCAAFCPTVVTAPMEVYERVLPVLATVAELPEFRHRVLGVHLEGPFISRQPGAHGAHKVDSIADADVALLDRLIDLARGHVALLTLAAEIPGSEALCRRAVERGVVVSLGHQLASGADMARLCDAGARMLTHLGNALPPLIPRHDNPLFAGLANDQLTAAIITDGFHLPPPVIKTVVRTKTVERVVVTSDIVSLGGMPPGDYDDSGLGDTCRLEPSGYLHMPSRNCMAGSSRTMLQCMNHLHSLRLLTPSELVQVGFHNPLRLLGITPADVHAQPMLHFDPEHGFTPS